MPASRVLLVEPVGFRANPETAADNAFQAPGADRPDPAVESAARAEVAAFRTALESRGVAVEAWTPEDAATPDAVFPNNWVSTAPDGTLVLYPMKARSRRGERRAGLIARLRSTYPDVVDWTDAESEDRFLEGTGSLVLDPAHRIAYASVSSRTDPGLVARWCARFGYAPLVFRAVDGDGREVYHTNVVVSVGTDWAVLCTDAVPDPADKGELLATLAETGHDVVEISLEQMRAFCGNVLELEGVDGRVVVMSARACRAFRPEQLLAIGRSAEIVCVDLPTIETHGGGSARCMIAELW